MCPPIHWSCTRINAVVPDASLYYGRHVTSINHSCPGRKGQASPSSQLDKWNGNNIGQDFMLDNQVCPKRFRDKENHLFGRFDVSPTETLRPQYIEVNWGLSMAEAMPWPCFATSAFAMMRWFDQVVRKQFFEIVDLQMKYIHTSIKTRLKSKVFSLERLKI